MSDHDRLREVIQGMRAEFANWPGRVGSHALASMARWNLVLDAAESTLPKTKMIETWNVEYAAFCTINDKAGKWEPRITACWTKDLACDMSNVLRRADDGVFTCIRVTGPHQQEVPA